MHIDITTIHSIHDLILLKEETKNLIVDKTLHWQDRIDMYLRVKLINERIAILTGRP